jgi:phosphohistidine phosphatase
MSLTEAYFIRHGIAQVRGDMADEARSLTPKGIDKTQRMAQRLAEFGLYFDALLSSPLVRARQTAEILQAAGLAKQIEEFLPLSPTGDLADWLSWLASWQATCLDRAAVAMVGHEPNLSEWAQQLVTAQGTNQGTKDGLQRDRWILKKAGIIGLELPRASHAVGNSQLFWLAPPRFLL